MLRIVCQDFFKKQSGLLQSPVFLRFKSVFFQREYVDGKGCYFQRFDNVLNDSLPIARLGLSEKFHRWIPRAVIAVSHPAPLASERQQQPDRLAERSGQMRHGCVDADHQIELINDGRSGGEVSAMCSRINRVGRLGDGCIHLVAGVELQTDKVGEIRFKQRLAVGPLHRAKRIISVLRIAGPDQTNV